MKTTRMKNFSVLFVIIVIVFSSSPKVVAQSQNDYHPQGIFNLSFYILILADSIDEPILPGETREVNVSITYGINTGGLFSILLFQLLEGKSFPIHLSIVEKSDWCEVWSLPGNITGIVSDSPRYQNSSFFLHVNDDAQGNYSYGYVKIRGTIESMKGPFNILTLINGFETHFVIEFTPGS
jgi:hypothetical protein